MSVGQVVDGALELLVAGHGIEVLEAERMAAAAQPAMGLGVPPGFELSINLGEACRRQG